MSEQPEMPTGRRSSRTSSPSTPSREPAFRGVTGSSEDAEVSGVWTGEFGQIGEIITLEEEG